MDDHQSTDQRIGNNKRECRRFAILKRQWPRAGGRISQSFIHASDVPDAKC